MQAKLNKKPTERGAWCLSPLRLASLFSPSRSCLGRIILIHNEQRGFAGQSQKWETEVRKNIPFSIAIRKIKYLGINLTKRINNLYSENYTTLRKKLKETQTSGSMYHVHRMKELASSKCSYYPKQPIDSMQSLLKYKGNFTDIEKNISKIYTKQKMTPNSLSNFEKEEQSRRDPNTWYQTMLQGHYNQNGLVLA